MYLSEDQQQSEKLESMDTRSSNGVEEVTRDLEQSHITGKGKYQF